MMGQDRAETVAVQALGWMAGEEERLGAFLSAAGCGPEELRARAAEAEFLGFVLDFLLQDEAGLIAFCDAAGLTYETPMQARAALPGGAQPHWT